MRILLISLFLTASVSADPFGDYWYQGKAEITSYTLSQARYGESHPGDAVMIFVTEDFSASKQVKLDRPNRTPSDAVKVLKLNALRKFHTGIYPYSMMSSIFSPVYADQHPRALKVTTSSQEWCGHTYTQLNLDQDGYRAKLLSYFEQEGDRELFWKDAILEDEIWNRIRLSPDALPSGGIQLVPGTMFQRLRHTAWGVHGANAAHVDHPTNDSLVTYTITYSDIERTLAITYERAFPHEIESWEETQRSGFGPNAKSITTTAKRKKRILSDYWRRHNLADSTLRVSLGLPNYVSPPSESR